MTDITKLGEFGLIERFRKLIKTDASVIQGSGDDCAVIELSRDKYLLFTCDMLIEGVDFTHKEEPYLIGRKALAVSISDIAACAGMPRYCVVALGLPRRTPISFVDKLFQGMRELAKEYKINIVGGDLSRAERLTIDVSMLGVVEKKRLILRSGAKIGDIVFVTGNLGGSIFGKHLKFIPRIKEARYLVKNFKINSMIDISDGLAQDLSHILEESKVGAVIYAALIPLAHRARNLQDALYMGEDFELIFTLSRNAAKKMLKNNAFNFIAIGEIVDKRYGLRLINKKGKEIFIHSRPQNLTLQGTDGARPLSINFKQAPDFSPEKLIRVKGFRHF
jgi:thiamine-monophosphate kinase